MINKQIFFIWFGEKPNFVDYAISNFKTVNPDWKIDLLWEKDLFNIKNEDFKEVIKVLRNEVYIKGFNEIIKKILNSKWNRINLIEKRKLAFLSDCFRYFLIFKYGGMYLDCDTFPVKPFDEDFINLIDNQYKIVTPYKDVFLIFGEKGYPFCGPMLYEKISYRREITNFNVHTSPKFEEYKRKFINCELKLGDTLFPYKREDYNKWNWRYWKYYYFDHYFIRSWKRNLKEPTIEELKEKEEFFKYIGF